MSLEFYNNVYSFHVELLSMMDKFNDLLVKNYTTISFKPRNKIKTNITKILYIGRLIYIFFTNKSIIYKEV